MAISPGEESPIPSSILFGSPLLFSLPLANKLGTKAATIVQQIHYWLTNSKTDLFDGKPFIRKTYKEINERFPWCMRTTKSVISKLEKLEILVSRVTWDRELSNKCKLYTINYDELLRLNPNFHDKKTNSETGVSLLVQSAKNCTLVDQKGGVKVQNLHFQPYIRDIYKNNTQQRFVDTDEPQMSKKMVLFFERVMTEGLKISEQQLKKWVSEHGVDYVTQKIELTKSSKPKNPEKFLAAAIKSNWLPAEKVLTLKPEEAKMSTFVVEPKHIFWFESLTEEGKNRALQDANTAFYMLQSHLDNQNVQISDPDFTSHSLFGLMMQTLNDYYRFQKPWEPVFEPPYARV